MDGENNGKPYRMDDLGVALFLEIPYTPWKTNIELKKKMRQVWKMMFHFKGVHFFQVPRYFSGVKKQVAGQMIPKNSPF